MFLDVINRLTHGLDLLGFLVRDGQLKLVFELHDQLDGVERVGVEVVDEVGFARNLALVHAHLFADDLDDLRIRFVHSSSYPLGFTLLAKTACKDRPRTEPLWPRRLENIAGPRTIATSGPPLSRGGLRVVGC